MNEEEHYINDNGDIGKYIMNEECYNKYMQNKNNIIIKIEKEIILRELTKPITNRLTEYTMSIIKRLIKDNPEFIIYIENIIIKISKNNKIDSNYIPEIILIISRLYNIILIIILITTLAIGYRNNNTDNKDVNNMIKLIWIGISLNVYYLL